MSIKRRFDVIRKRLDEGAYDGTRQRGDMEFPTFNTVQFHHDLTDAIGCTDKKLCEEILLTAYEYSDDHEDMVDIMERLTSLAHRAVYAGKDALIPD